MRDGCPTRALFLAGFGAGLFVAGILLALAFFPLFMV